MVRALRALVLAVVIAASFVLSGSVASAHPIHVQVHGTAPAVAPALPARLDITWE